MIEILDCEQGTAEWLALRAGIPTASEFATVMRTKGKADDGSSKERRTYMLKLAGEILTGEPAESYTNPHMERGKVMEAEARGYYAAFVAEAPLQRVGFIRRGQCGCSPDSLVGANGGLEIKTALPHILLDKMLKGEFPPEHRAQVQGNAWLAEREWWDLETYWPKLDPFIIRAYRDEPYIRTISDAVDRFNDELAALVERIRRYGVKQEVAA
jgi:hypothetical protein